MELLTVGDQVCALKGENTKEHPNVQAAMPGATSGVCETETLD